MRLIDLSMPIAPHFRWRTQLAIAGDIAAGDQFRISRLDGPCHGFSHVDAQAHIMAAAPTIEWLWVSSALCVRPGYDCHHATHRSLDASVVRIAPHRGPADARDDHGD